MKFVVPFVLFFSGLVLQAQTASTPTLADAQQFMTQAEARLSELSVKLNRASWVQENFISDDTEALSADAQDQITGVATELIGQAKRFDGLNMPPDLARKFLLLRLSLTAPAPRDPALRKEMTQIGTSLDADYGKAKYCRMPDHCLDITAIENIMETSRDPKELRDVWLGWHKISAPMRDRYARFVELSNQGARELGFKDTGELWRAGYDMPPDAFSADVERLWRRFVHSIFSYTLSFAPDSRNTMAQISFHRMGQFPLIFWKIQGRSFGEASTQFSDCLTTVAATI